MKRCCERQKPRDFSRLKLRLRPFCPWPRRAASSAGEATWNSSEPICECSTMAVVVEWKSCDEANEAFVFLPPLQTSGTLLRCPTSARCPTWRIKPGRVDLEINASWIINLKCSFNPLFVCFFCLLKRLLTTRCCIFVLAVCCCGPRRWATSTFTTRRSPTCLCAFPPVSELNSVAWTYLLHLIYLPAHPSVHQTAVRLSAHCHVPANKSQGPAPSLRSQIAGAT